MKFLPSYALPAGRPSKVDLPTDLDSPDSSFEQGQPRPSVNLRPRPSGGYNHDSSASQADGAHRNSESGPRLPLPVTSAGGVDTNREKLEYLGLPLPSATSAKSRYAKESMAEQDDLFPARMPPQYSYFDIFPFSLLVKFLTRRGKNVKGKKGARLRAKLLREVVSHNLPLEISLYLVRFSQ